MGVDAFVTVVARITQTETEIRVMELNEKSPEELFGLNWLHDGQALAWQSGRVAKKPRRRNGAYASYEASTGADLVAATRKCSRQNSSFSREQMAHVSSEQKSRKPDCIFPSNYTAP